MVNIHPKEQKKPRNRTNTQTVTEMHPKDTKDAADVFGGPKQTNEPRTRVVGSL